MYELMLINLALFLSFMLVTILVLKKSQNISSLAFSWTSSLFALSTFFGVFEEMYNSQILAGSTPQLLTILDNIIFPLAPLGLMFSAYVIKKGYSAWKDLNVWIFTIVYTIIEVVLFIIRFQGIGFILDETMNIAVANFLVVIPLVICLIFFYLVYQDMDEERNKMLILITGVAIGTLGQLVNVLSIIITNDTITAISYIIIVVGVLIVSLSFMNITSVRQHTTSPSTVN